MKIEAETEATWTQAKEYQDPPGAGRRVLPIGSGGRDTLLLDLCVRMNSCCLQPSSLGLCYSSSRQKLALAGHMWYVRAGSCGAVASLRPRGSDLALSCATQVCCLMLPQLFVSLLTAACLCCAQGWGGEGDGLNLTGSSLCKAPQVRAFWTALFSAV